MKQEVLDKKVKKEKDTPWTNIGIKVDLCSFLTRKVLVEKYNSQKAKETEMREFFISKIDGCELYLNDIYPDYIFYINKNKEGKNEILMEKCEKNKTFYIKNTGIWSVFESSYMLQYDEVQLLTQHLLEDLLNSKGYKTSGAIAYSWSILEDLLNSKGYKTFLPELLQCINLEDLLNSKGYKTGITG